jgi:hypothetical protein
MRRKHSPAPARPGRHAARLIALSEGLESSGSRLEDHYWEDQLSRLLTELLDARNDAPLQQALDALQDRPTGAYGVLADAIENACERIEGEPPVQLIALPVLAASAYQIGSGQIDADVLSMLRVQLSAHVLASGATLSLLDTLLSPDQLPAGHTATRSLSRQLATHSPAGRDLHIEARTLAPAEAYSTDIRYVLGAISIVPGAPVWRWNEADATRDTVLAAWRQQAEAAFRRLLPGCLLQLVLPEAYHAAWRQAERDMRPFSIQAAAMLLQTRLPDVSALRASYAPFGEERLEEYRIGFTHGEDDSILHGVIWPLLDAAEDSGDTPEAIEATLRAAGIQHIRRLQEQFLPEFCEDCGTPLYPTPQAELGHPVDENDSPAARQHLH